MLKITFVNSGYAEGILITCPDKNRKNGTFVMTVDGGGFRTDEFENNTSGRIPMVEYLKEIGLDHIDLMVSTHTHEDHICGQLECAKLLPPTELWQTLPPQLYKEFENLDLNRGTNLSQVNFLSALNAYTELCEITEESSGKIRQICSGYMYSPCEGLTIRVLSPNATRESLLEESMKDLYDSAHSAEFLSKLDEVDHSLNNFSMILMLEYRGKKILLPGDTNRDGFGDLTAEDLRADIYKVGHHGQMDGATEELVQMVQPDYVVCCASSDRRYNSAHPDLIAMIEKTGAGMYYSDCPVDGIEAHQAVQFTVADDGKITAKYIR